MNKKSSSVYVLHNPEFGMTKVGISRNISNRVAAIETACGCELVLRYSSLPMEGAYEAEQLIHSKLASDRARGEWFYGDVNKIESMTRNICNKCKPDIRIEMYKGGESVTKIAERQGVSRQAIVKFLQKTGVYKTPSDVVSKERSVSAQERVSRYEAGESVSSIARAAGVSRQAILQTLKGVGIWEPGGIISPSIEARVKLSESPVDSVRVISGCPIDGVPEVDFASIKGRRRLGRNLYADSRGYIVFDYGSGGERRFSSREEVMSAYPGVR